MARVLGGQRAVCVCLGGRRLNEGHVSLDFPWRSLSIIEREALDAGRTRRTEGEDGLSVSHCLESMTGEGGGWMEGGERGSEERPEGGEWKKRR